MNPNLAISSLLAIVFSESTITKKGAWASFRGIHALKIALAFFDPLFTVINMKILITGSNGLLGQKLVKLLLQSALELTHVNFLRMSLILNFKFLDISSHFVCIDKLNLIESKQY